MNRTFTGKADPVDVGYEVNLDVEVWASDTYHETWFKLSDFLRDVKAHVSPGVWERLWEDVEA